MNLEKHHILNKLNKKLEDENTKNIYKYISDEEDINYKLVKCVLEQYQLKINDKVQYITVLKKDNLKKDNTIFKNNIIIDKLNVINKDNKENIENYQDELISINNNYSLEIMKFQDVLENKNEIIVQDNKQITELSSKYDIVLKKNNKLQSIVKKNNTEILYIYKYNFYLLFIHQILNYINVYWLIQIIIIFSVYIYLLFRFRLNFNLMNVYRFINPFLLE